MNIYSGSIIPGFRCHITIWSCYLLTYIIFYRCKTLEKARFDNPVNARIQELDSRLGEVPDVETDAIPRALVKHEGAKLISEGNVSVMRMLFLAASVINIDS
jgi:hypothetical protein